MTLLPLHVAGGVIGILSGFVALYVFKGGALHRKSGTIFVYAMLVITSLLTVRPPSARTRQLERGAMVAAFALGVSGIVAAIVSGAKGNVGFVYPLMMFAALALSAGVGDRRMIHGGGLVPA